MKSRDNSTRKYVRMTGITDISWLLGAGGRSATNIMVPVENFGMTGYLRHAHRERCELKKR